MQDRTAVIDADARNRQKFVFHKTLLRRVVVGTLRKVLPMIMKVETSGLDNLPEDGPVILASNHLTNYDVFPMQMVIQRPLFFMAKAELHNNPLMDAALRSLGAFPVQRGKRDQWAIRHAARVLEHGQVLAMFPEGTRSRGRGLRAGKTGAARLALGCGCLVVPAAITGTQAMFTNFPRRTVISLVFGAALQPREDDTTLGLTDRLMFAIADLLPFELRGVYAKKPVGFGG